MTPLTPTPTPPSGEYKTPTLPRGKTIWIIIALASIVLLAVAMSGEIFPELSIGEIVSIYNSPDPPPIALNPPNETEREQLANTLIEQGYKEEEIGEIEEHYVKDNVPEMIPISESVLIQNLRIIGDDEVRFTVKNVADKSVSAPFYTIDAQIFVKHPNTGEPFKLELRRIAWVEIGEEKMQPGEEREIVIENLFDKLDALGYEEYYNISSVEIVYEEFMR